MTIPEVSAADLLRALERAPLAPDEVPQVLDVRAPERAALGQIPAPVYVNLPGSRVLPLPDAAVLGLDRSRPVVVVCDRGLSSRPVTQLLRSQGFDASSLAGGMLGWMLATVRRPVPGISGLDLLVQVDRVGKAALGYFALRQGEAVIVDPSRDPVPWNALLTETGARLVGVVETHCHADYLSGGPALAEAHRVPYRLHPADAIDPYTGRASRIPFAPLSDGEKIALGDTHLTVEHTPGHTEGSVVLRLGDELALTGDFLFVESIGRPDLAGRTAAWTDLLWRSLERARSSWNPGLRIFPAHYAGEGERAASRVVEGRFGELASHNPPFAIANAAEFAAWVAARTGIFPEEYRYIKQANLGWLDVPPALADELEAGKNQCALSQ